MDNPLNSIKSLSKNHLYRQLISSAIDSLNNNNYDEAEAFAVKAIAIDCNLPDAHNLLGAIYELKGDNIHAERHYLAANSLDPTYLPAIRNIRRLTTFSFQHKRIHPDLGNEKLTILE